ncbi:hypothetical protein ACLD12_18220, partial [Salmonella sp. 741265143_HSA]|nr:hypothetical protein [Salmonella enterica]
LPVEFWGKVQSILNARYTGVARNVLVNEKQWLQKVTLNLLFEARLHEGLDRIRIERLVPYHALKSL